MKYTWADVMYFMNYTLWNTLCVKYVWGDARQCRAGLAATDGKFPSSWETGGCNSGLVGG